MHRLKSAGFTTEQQERVKQQNSDSIRRQPSDPFQTRPEDADFMTRPSPADVFQTHPEEGFASYVPPGTSSSQRQREDRYARNQPDDCCASVCPGQPNRRVAEPYGVDTRPPAEPIIPVWYPAENNWRACQERMAYAYTKIGDEFSGERFQEQRIQGESKKDKMMDYLYDQSGGKMGKQYQVKTRTANVVDLYQDWRFPADSNSWYRGGRPNDFTVMAPPARWRRLCEDVTDTPYQTINPVAGVFSPTQGRVYQGAMEDYYLVAAMQAIGMKPQLVANCFANMDFSDPSLGCFIIRLFKHGQWHYVEIDDALPYDKNFNPLCSTGEYFPSFAWSSLLEKAYAKLHGSWEGLGGGGHIEEVMADLTGGCASRFGTTDVAADRLFQYLEANQSWCIWACNICEGECSKRNVPLQGHWACSIYQVKRVEGMPYVCVVVSAPTSTVRHMPVCDVPTAEGYGIHDGFAWLRIDDFVTLFDTMYECRLVNSDLGPPQVTGIPYSPGWVAGSPWFEEMWAFQGDVYSETAPSFLMEVLDTPNEITIEVSQTDVRYNDPHQEPENGRGLQAPLLLRFYQVSREASDQGGGEIYLVHLSPWGHCRDACTGVKVLRPGKYLAMVSMPAQYVCHRMIFRSYSTRPLAVKPLTSHRNWVSVNPARPLDAIPYALAGFQRVDAYSEKLPQMFDEGEGRGKPMANPLLVTLARMRNPKSVTGWRKQFAAEVTRYNQDDQGMRVVGKFGGRDAVATTRAAEVQDCSVM